VVLQTTPALVGVRRYLYWLCSTFFRSAPNVVSYSIRGVLADAPGMDMMLNSMVSKKMGMLISLKIFG
jgi:hypothetical protein